MYQTAGIRCPQPLDHFVVIVTVSAFVSGGPGEDTGMIFVPVICPGHSLHIGFPPLGLVADPLGITVQAVVSAGISFRLTHAETMGLNVCLQHYIKTQFVAIFQETRCRRIVGSSHAVDVQAFHQYQILPDFLIGHGKTIYRMGVVVVYAFQLYFHAIYGESTSFIDTIFYEAHALAENFLFILEDQLV